MAIAISTRNRPGAFERCYNSVVKYSPGCQVFVVDDHSENTYIHKYGDKTSIGRNTGVRFIPRRGISQVKNKCLQLCYESGADHIFLIDDDTEVLKENWFLPYIESGEHHLCATFLPDAGTFVSKIIIDQQVSIDHCSSKELLSKSQEMFPEFKFKEMLLKRHHAGNGYCLYFTRHCIDTVGGFDTRFNNKYEHNDLSRRIHAAGLVKYKYQDIYNSSELIYCLDQDKAIERSFSEKEMQANLKAGYELYRHKECDNTSEYIEFRT